MRAINIKKLAAASALSLVTILGTSGLANAQDRSRDRNDQRDDQNQQRKITKQQEKMDRDRAQAEQKRIQEEQKRQANQNRRYPPVTQNQNGNNNHNGRVNNNNNRYRIYRNGRYYNTDNRGADLLRQAVNAGYQQGLQAGRNDRSSRRRSSWTNSNIYQSGTYGYQSYVDRSQYQYYFQQGFQRGYQDGYNSRYQYGSDNGGSPSILGTILGQILNVQTY